MWDYLQSTLFWVATVQWLSWPPAVFYAQRKLANRKSVMANAAVELLLLFVVGGSILFVPLMVLGLYPVPGQDSQFLAVGAVIGGLLSVLPSMVIRRRST